MCNNFGRPRFCVGHRRSPGNQVHYDARCLHSSRFTPSTTKLLKYFINKHGTPFYFSDVKMLSHYFKVMRGSLTSGSIPTKTHLSLSTLHGRAMRSRTIIFHFISFHFNEFCDYPVPFAPFCNCDIKNCIPASKGTLPDHLPSDDSQNIALGLIVNSYFPDTDKYPDIMLMKLQIPILALSYRSSFILRSKKAYK